MFPKHFTPPSHTAFEALQRFSLVMEWLYNRPINWDRSTWQPRTTPRQKLTTWCFLSLIVPSFAIYAVFILLQQLVSYQKDPDVSIVMGIFIIFGSSGYTVASSAILTETLKLDELCVMLKFLRKFEAHSTQPSDLFGLFLHGLILAVIMPPLTCCTLPILAPKMNPTYLLFRNVSLISHNCKIILRSLIIFVSTLHACSELLGFAIIATNVTLTLNGCLKVGKIGDTHAKFVTCSQIISSFRRYRQLQIFNSIVNQVMSYILPVGMSLTFLCMVLMGYFLIKMTHLVPHTITFCVGSVLATLFCLAVAILPKMADVSVNSANFVRYWKLQRTSRYLSRQLKSFKCLRLDSGQFGYLKKASGAEVLSQFLYFVMSLVIMI
ncbi:hypothetical protein Fcan01_25012 [Folsomia candida]|uniref:Odorant receptor n=1 Tax=Folsomia candida TaxID=158441 RepID=A0A226D6S5_FOLCA|nr:hypothetical protein Fcan01_25012 [Folsomia candida]